MEHHLKTVLVALADRGVSFVVAGGVALVLHGVERVTLDLDVAVRWEPENLRGFLEVVDALGLKPRAPVAAGDLLDPRKVAAMIEEKEAFVFTFVDPSLPLRQVDVFLREDHSFERLSTDAETVSLWGRSFRVVSKRRLLALKRGIQPPRPKDKFDIEELERLLGDQG